MKELHGTVHPSRHFHFKEEKNKFHFDFPDRQPIEDVKNIIYLINFVIPLDRIEIHVCSVKQSISP